MKPSETVMVFMAILATGIVASGLFRSGVLCQHVHFYLNAIKLAHSLRHN